jgi:polyhydroxyalkanoate synthase
MKPRTTTARARKAATTPRGRAVASGRGTTAAAKLRPVGRGKAVAKRAAGAGTAGAKAARRPATAADGTRIDPALTRNTPKLSASLKAFARAALTQPGRSAKAAGRLGAGVVSAVRGASALEPATGDRRFEDPAWRENPLYRRLLQGYLSMSSEAQRWVGDLALAPRDEARARMLLAMVTDTLAPTNTLLGNPGALKRTLETGGANLASGVRSMVGDWRKNGGLPASVDASKFRVGENLALTPGAVVHRDATLELIQYRPQTGQVHGTPVFIVPPQINKYYVWDLAPGRSLVEFLVARGHQVFIVSWFNPGEAQADWDLATYVRALESAMGVTRRIAACDQLHVMGACSGGITAAALLAYLAAKKKDWARTLTLLVSILDIEGIADSSMGLFANLETLELARSLSGARGVLKGKDLAKVFAWLRPNELIWNYWVNNYLLGKAPPAFDILYWNSDTTRLPARLHADFIALLESNAFVTPGGLAIDGRPLDLSDVTCDSYILGGTTDHITPWEGCYQTRRLLGGKSHFVLSSSGHVQSIVNPPGGRKSAYSVNDGEHDSPEAFAAGATLHEGTWWPHLSDWLAARSDADKPAPRALGSRSSPPLADAPGTYVHVPG